MIKFCYHDNIRFHEATMTESKPSTPSRLLRPGAIISNPPAPGSPYTPRNQYPMMPPRAKLNPVSQSSAATIIQPSLISTVTTRFQVPLQIGSKAPIIVSTSYKPITGSGAAATPRVYPGHTSVEKISTPLNAVSVDTHVKANVKPVPISKVSYVKQISSATAKPVLSTVPVPNVIQAPNKKDIDMTKSVPVLLGPGLRQVNKAIPYGDHSQPVNVTRLPVQSNSWIIHQQDSTTTPAVSNTSTVPSSVSRTKPQFQNSSVTVTTTVASSAHDLSKKLTNPSTQPKTTISIMPTLSNIPPSEATHRNALSATSVLSTGNKPIYQVVPPGFQTTIQSQNSAIKKLPVPTAMIVSQALSNTTTGFASPQPVLTTGQITVMTCGAGITYVPAPNPPNVTNTTSIPIAKVYPQQQPASRVSITSTSSRLSVPVISSVNTPSSTASRTATPALLQVGPIKSTPTTSTVMTSQSTSVSTIPVAANKSVALCWPANLNYTAQLAISTAGSATTPRPNVTLTSTPNQLQVATAIRVQHSNVLTTHLQGAGGAAPSLLQVTDAANRSNPSHNTASQQTGNPTTPTMSPKPAILRRQRPDSSSALKKLSFTTSSSFPNPRRDFHPISTDRRPAPYHINRQKITNSAGETKDVPLVIPAQNDKGETKPVLPNQVYGSKIIPSNGFTPLKVNSLKSHSSQFSNSAKDGGNQSFSIHPVNIDLKVKMEPGHSNYSTSPQQQAVVKSESSSASQMLHFQNQSMHTYAAESPQVPSNVPHRIVTQASGQHVRTNTIFAKPTSHPAYPAQQRSKSAQVKSIPGSGTTTSTGPGTIPQPYLPPGPINHGVNSFMHHRIRTDLNHPGERISAFDHVKKEQRTKLLPNTEQQTKTSVDNIISQLQNHAPPNHLIPAISPAKLWSNVNNSDQMTGLSPRKRPRKQTHVVSEYPPDVVMEDEESTDDADECEDEPMIDTSHNNISTTPSTKLPGHKPSSIHHRQPKNEPPINKKMIKEENTHKSSYIKSEPPTSPSLSETKPLSEYTDRDGVRYVASRKRPSVAILNKAKPHSRPISNHYMYYSDVRVKDKKTTISDLSNDKKRLKGVKVARLAFQFNEMVSYEKDIWERIRAVFDGLVEYKSSLLADATFESNLASPSPGTPTSLSNSFRKATPRSSRSNSMSAISENGPVNSPSTPLDRRTHRVKDEISNIEELAQANLQRCRVVSDQISDAKTMLLKSIDHRQLVTNILESSMNQKTQSHTSNNTQSMKRMPKKKNNS